MLALRRNPNFVRLVEANSNDLHGWRGITVFYASPGHPPIHRFLKNQRVVFVIPTWSLQELRTYNAIPKPQLPMDDAMLVRRFNAYGGIPHDIFNMSPLVVDGLLNEALAVFRACTAIDFVVRAMTQTDYSHRLVKMVPTRADYKQAYKMEFLSTTSLVVWWRS